MNTSNMTTNSWTPVLDENRRTQFCTGCFPIYQPNQLAHSEEGGCLWCPFLADDQKYLQIENDLEKIIKDELDTSLISMDSLDAVSTNSTETECCICFETINKQKNNCVTECGHMFCLKCLANSMYYDKWNCPYCRTSLIDINNQFNANDYEEYDEDEDTDDDDTDDDDEDTEVDESHGDADANVELDNSNLPDPNQELEEGEIHENMFDEMNVPYDNQDYSEYDDPRYQCPIDDLTQRITDAGFTTRDLVAMLVGRYHGRYSLEEEINMNRRFEQVIRDADGEYYDRAIIGDEDENSVS